MKKLTKSKLILQASISTIVAALAVVGIVSASTTIGTNISTGGTLTVSGANTFSGSTTLGDASTDVNLFTGTLQASTTALFTNGLTSYHNIKIPAAYSLDVISAGALNIGTSTATSLAIGNTGAITAIGGRLTIPAAYSLDVASAGALNIGTTTANAITIGKSGITTTFPGDVTVSGTFSPSQTSATEFYVGGGYGSTGLTLNSIGGLYANGSSTINGILTVGTNMTAYGLDRPDAGILGIGTSTATTITIGHTGATTTIGGNLTIPAGYTFDTATAGTLYIGTSSANAITIGKSGITTTFPGNVTVTGTLSQGNTQLIANSLLVGGGYGSTGLTIDDLGGLYANGSSTINGILTVGTNMTAYGLDRPDAGILGIGTSTATTITIGHTGATTTIGGNLTIPAGYTFDTATAGTLYIGTSSANAITIGKSGITTTFPGNVTVTGTFSQGNTQLVTNSLLVGGGYGSTGLTIDDLGGLYTNGSTTIGGLLSVPAHYGLDVSSAGTLNIGTTTADAITIGRSGITTTFPGNTSVTGTDTVTNASTTRETIGNGTTITGFLFGSCSVDFGTSIVPRFATTTNCAATGVTTAYKVFMTPMDLEQDINFSNASTTSNNVIQVQVFNNATSTITTAAHNWNWMAIK